MTKRTQFLSFTFLFLIALTTGYASEPPKGDQAFQLSVRVVDPNTLALQWNIQPDFFLYQDRFKIETKDELFHIGRYQLPKAETKTFRDGKSYQVYRNSITLLVPVLGNAAGESSLDVRYQGCADSGYCYPPENANVQLNFNKDLELQSAQIEKEAKTANLEEIPATQYDELFSSNNLFLIILGFIGFGLLLAFTPCVLPMVPVLSGLIVGHGENLTTRKAFFLSLSYVLSMSITYAIVGALVALLGSNLQIAMQSPIAISTFSLIFIVLSLSMFGLYELRFPSNWQNKIAGLTRNQATGHYLGAAIMGALSTLILSPCVTAPLIGVLGYIASTGSWLFGSIALFSLGFGMGLPLLLIGASAGKILPKAGNWMNEVKAFFGVLLIAMAIYLMGRILPITITMTLWGSLLIFCGIFLGAFNRTRNNLQKFNQGLGIIGLVYGILILVGASQGNSNPLMPLVTSTASTLPPIHSPLSVVTTLAETQDELERVKGKPVILDFYADWCTSCKTIAKTTLQDPAVVKLLEDFIFIKLDVTANNQRSKELLNHFNVVAPPTFLFLDQAGDELSSLRLEGDVKPEQFIERLKKLPQSNHPESR